MHKTAEKTHLVTGGMCLYSVRFVIFSKKKAKKNKVDGEEKKKAICACALLYKDDATK